MNANESKCVLNHTYGEEGWFLVQTMLNNKPGIQDQNNYLARPYRGEYGLFIDNKVLIMHLLKVKVNCLTSGVNISALYKSSICEKEPSSHVFVLCRGLMCTPEYYKVHPQVLSSVPWILFGVPLNIIRCTPEYF